MERRQPRLTANAVSDVGGRQREARFPSKRKRLRLDGNRALAVQPDRLHTFARVGCLRCEPLLVSVFVPLFQLIQWMTTSELGQTSFLKINFFSH